MKSESISKSLFDTADRVIANTYQRFPLALVRGDGCTLWDADGKSYTDFVAGIAVCNLGHAHPKIAEAVALQAKTLIHVSNLYYTLPQTELAEMLVTQCFADRVFFCNSGAEANEAAIKLARRYFFDRGEKDRYRIISMERSFHGRTMATLSATGQGKIKVGFDPVLEGFDFVPFNDIQALEAKLDETVCGVLLEPVQGEGGVRVPDADYLKGVRRLCDERGILLIFDEVQTGMGRTGKLFAHEHFDVTPHIMTLAKALANGLPMGAMLATEKVASAFVPGTHATTFGGTPIVAAAALENLKILTREGIMDHCREMGEYLRERLAELMEHHSFILDVRGMGLLCGMKISVPAAPIVRACMKKGFLVNAVQEKILRFVPPLIVEKEQIDALISCLEEIFQDPDLVEEGG